MANKKTIPDSVSASLDYDLAVILSSHVDHRDEYNTRADFVREAIWEKLQEEYRTSEALDEFINRQEELIKEHRKEAENMIQDLQTEIDRLNTLKEERDEAVVEEADELFNQLEDAELRTEGI